MSETVYTLTLPIETPEQARLFFEGAFRAVSRVHNTLVSHVIGRMNILNHNAEYKRLKSEYGKIAGKKELTEYDKRKLREIGNKLNKIIRKSGMSQSAVEKYAKVIGKKYSHYLASQQVQKEADRVWAAVKKVLYSNGKQIHYKRQFDFDTISGKSNKNGIRFDPKTLTFTWMNETYRCYVSRTMSREYLAESLTRKISYCDIKRLMFPNGWKYYLVITLEGSSPLTHEHSDNGVMGIDIGTSTVAGAFTDKLYLEILADGVERYNIWINDLNRKMDVSRRLTNPNRFNADGTYRKGYRGRWTFSKNYMKNRRRYKSLNRRRSAFVESMHRKLANLMIQNTVHFVVEAMNFAALAKRAKETKRESEPKMIVDKKGNVRLTRKYIRKKRYGHSILCRAPSLFLNILERKANRYGGELSRVNTSLFKASQYNHQTDTYTNLGINCRFKQIGDTTVQRDLYSAFLLSNTDISLEHADREHCRAGFAKFVELHSTLISEMKAAGITRKTCFGF